MAKQEQVLIIEPANELTFVGPFTSPVSSVMILRNPTEQKIWFKIKTTAPKRYCVKPNSGVIDPKQHVQVAVSLQPFEYDPNDKNRHKFMVQSMFAPDGEINQDTLWKETAGNQLMDSKLRCVFVLDNQDSGNFDGNEYLTAKTELPAKMGDWQKDSTTRDKIIFVVHLQHRLNVGLNNQDCKPSPRQLNKMADDIAHDIARTNIHESVREQEARFDTVSVGYTKDRKLIVTANVKERKLENGDIVYGQYGLQSNMTDSIKNNIRKNIPKYKEDFEVKIVKVAGTRNVDRFTNARDHAEMQALAYARQTGDSIEGVGVSKPPCAPCEQQLDRQNVEHDHDGDGLQSPRNWEDPENIETEAFATISKRKVKVEGNLWEISHNIPKNMKDVKSGLKNNIRQQLIPKPHVVVTAAGILDVIDQIDRGGSAHAGTMNAYAGTYEKEKTLRMGGYAGASVAEASANYSIFGASATALSANAHYEVGLNNSIGASATLARAEAHAGPVGVGVGLSLDTGAGVGIDGVHASVAGFGFRVGPKMEIKTPVVDVSCCVM